MAPASPSCSRAASKCHELPPLSGIIFFALLVISQDAVGGEVAVTDGDGLRIGKERIRLWGIDSPEIGQKCTKLGVTYDCGITGREVLIRLIGGSSVECTRVNADRYGRTVAECAAAGKDLGAEMVREGWALDFTRYSHGQYAGDEEEARTKKPWLVGRNIQSAVGVAETTLGTSTDNNEKKPSADAPGLAFASAN